MLRGLVWVLRQRRYATLALGMVLLAMGCAAAGTFEIHRLQEKRSDNARLIANAHAAPASLTPSLVPLTAGGRAVAALTVGDRTVTAAGRYDAAAQEYVGNQSQGGRPGFWVLTPLRSVSGTLLVARGFVAATAAGTPPAHVPAPPTGSVRITGWLQPSSTSASRIGDEVSAIDAQQQTQRLGSPVYEAYLTLDAHQPGTAGLSALPGPTLSNPTGGAAEWQLLSYVVQWYVFAALALAAPFLFARNEIRAARRRFLGVDPDREDFDLRLGSPRPAAGSLAGRSGGTDLAVRPGGTVARSSDAPAGVRRAVRLADRYGLSLGPDVDPGAEAVARDEPRPRRHRIGGVPDRPDRSPAEPNRTSSGLPLSADAYHGSYNDYLWQLALADGEVPDGRLSGGPDALPAADRGTQPATGITGAEDRGAEGRTIDGVVIEPEPDEHHD